MDKTLYCYLTIVTKVNNETKVAVIDLSKEDRDTLLSNGQIQLQKRDKEDEEEIIEYYKLIINK